jgi:hypothetical protein
MKRLAKKISTFLGANDLDFVNPLDYVQPPVARWANFCRLGHFFILDAVKKLN